MVLIKYSNCPSQLNFTHLTFSDPVGVGGGVDETIFNQFQSFSVQLYSIMFIIASECKAKIKMEGGGWGLGGGFESN